MKALKKKQVVLTALVAMIGLAGYFNWMYENSDNGSVTDSDEVALGEARLVSGTNIKEDYFEKSRLERDTGRSKAMESLKTVSENPESDPETKKEAEQKIIKMSERTPGTSAPDATATTPLTFGYSSFDTAILPDEDTARSPLWLFSVTG